VVLFDSPSNYFCQTARWNLQEEKAALKERSVHPNVNRMKQASYETSVKERGQNNKITAQLKSVEKVNRARGTDLHTVGVGASEGAFLWVVLEFCG
jgi:hypothetical protein